MFKITNKDTRMTQDDTVGMAGTVVEKIQKLNCFTRRHIQ